MHLLGFVQKYVCVCVYPEQLDSIRVQDGNSVYCRRGFLCLLDVKQKAIGLTTEEEVSL